MKIVFLDAATMGDVSFEPIAAKGELVCYDSSTPQEALERVSDCDVLIVNKIDVLPYFDFDMDKVVEYAHMRNPNLKIFPICAKTGEGVDAWCDWLADSVAQWNGR